MPDNDPQTAAASPEQAQPAKPKRKRRRLRLCVRLGALLLLLAVAVPLMVVWWYTRPAQLIPLIEQALYESTGLEASITNARVTAGGEITLEGVTLSVPGMSGEFAVVMTAERIEMAGNARGFLDSSYRPDRIVIIRPVLRLSEDASSGLFNYEQISAPTGGDGDVPIPEVRIVDGKIRFDQLRKDGMHPLGAMGVAGELRPDGTTPKAYRFTIAETDPPQGRTGIRFTGGFDLNMPSLDLRADHFRLAEEQQYFLPAEIRQWWARLAPTGEVPELDLSLRPDLTGTLDVHQVRLRFQDVELNLDVLDRSDPIQRDIGRMLLASKGQRSRVSGSVTIDHGKIDLQGSGSIDQKGLGLSPIAFTVQGQAGLYAEDPYKVYVKTQPFTLSDRYQYALAFSPLTGDGYRRFRPSGRFQVDAMFSSAGEDAPLGWAIGLNILEGQMSHTMFPLTLEQVKGKVAISAARVDIGPLTAQTASGAKVALAGFTQPASDTAEVKLDIVIKDLPLDDALRRALGTETSNNLNRFFDVAAYDKLVQRKLIKPDDNAVYTAPKFALGGTVDVFVPVYRPEGVGKEYSVVPVVDLKGVNVLMKDFPYPLTADGGSITIGGDFVKIEDLSLTSPTSGGLTLNGSANKGADGEYRPQISIENASLPIDPLLLSALGKDAETLLTDLGITGVLSAKGQVFQRPTEAEPDLALDVKVARGTVTPYKGRITVGDVAGAFKLRASGIDSLKLKGKRGKTTIALDGKVDWSGDNGDTTALLKFDATKLAFAPELLDVLPKDSELRADLDGLYKDYQPEGVIDGELTWELKGGDEEDGFIAKLTPQTLAFNLLGGRLSFTEMSGGVTVYSDLMQLNKLAGTFKDPDGATGRLQSSGEIGFDKEPRIGLAFTGNSSTVGQTVRVLMPDSVNAVLDTLKYEGGLKVGEAELIMTRVGGEQAATRFTGDFTLPGVSMSVGGLPLEDLKGTLDVVVDSRPGKDMPDMSYALSVDSMLANRRKVEKFRIAANNKQDPKKLRTGRGTGTIYDGTLVIEASIDLFSEGGTRLNAALLDAQVAPLLKPDDFKEQAQPDAPDKQVGQKRVIDRTLKSGLLSASLMLDTSYDKDGPRYGSGEVRMRDAGLLADTPLELWAVQALNLTLPDSRGFDRGAAKFDIDGNRIIFEELWMETRGTELNIMGLPVFQQGLRIAGTGAVTMPDFGLDLKLSTEVTGTVEDIPFGVLLSAGRNELLGIQVGGTLQKPKVTYETFRDTREIWEQLFQKKK